MNSIELNFKGTYFWLLQVTVLEANSRIGGRAVDDDTSTFSTQSHIVIGCYNNPVVVMSKQVRYLFDYFMNVWNCLDSLLESLVAGFECGRSWGQSAVLIPKTLLKWYQ